MTIIKKANEEKEKKTLSLTPHMLSRTSPTYTKLAKDSEQRKMKQKKPNPKQKQWL